MIASGETMKTVNVAMVGFGTVGSGVARILLESGDDLAARAGVRLKLKYICDVDLTRDRGVKVPAGVLTNDLERVLSDPEVTVVCELIGGTTTAYDVVERCLRAGKNVVTANKALLAERGLPLAKLAREAGRAICFEAAVAGGIPLILAVRDGLVANRITGLTGILNGTSNYILTSMTNQGTSYKKALAEAQAKGYAEADPTLDVSGGDSAHKLTVLARLAFGVPARFEDVHCEGIQKIEAADVRYAAELDYTIKLLAIGRRGADGGVSLRVHPAFVPRSNPLAHVDGAFNAIMVRGDEVGDTLYYGAGAGQRPTASAVVADLVDVALGRAGITFAERDVFSTEGQGVVQSIDDVRSRYYLRFDVADQPGVLSRIAGVLGSHNISIASVLQHEPMEATQVALMIMTHAAVERDMRVALKEFAGLGVVHNRPVCIRVLDEERSR
jgi:homoserine dehydrogenase